MLMIVFHGEIFYRIMKSNFFDDVVDLVKLIPHGRVTTYGAIAKYLGASKSSRTVGWVLSSQSIKHNLPAHRVVNRLGVLSGKNHFPHLLYMQQKLEEEGLIITEDKVLNFEKLFWDPNKELTL